MLILFNSFLLCNGMNQLKGRVEDMVRNEFITREVPKKIHKGFSGHPLQLKEKRKHN
jgi:hypothetical protein